MKYRKMPSSGDNISVLGFGCMRLPTKFGKIDKKRATKQIKMAIDEGVNYIDTAYPYHFGQSEKFLGENILNTKYRDKVKLATKLPTFLIKEKSDFYKYFKKQKNKLNVKVIDYYLMHTLNGESWEKMKKLGIIDFMDELKKSGEVSNIGFSFHGEKKDFFKIIDDYDWDFCQVQYNIIDKHYQAGIEGIDYAYEKNIGVIIMEPLKGGQIVGKVPKEIKKIWNETNNKRKPVDWAFRYILDHPGVITVLSGMNEEEHIKENINIVSEIESNNLTNDEKNTINKIRKKYEKLIKIKCTNCGYCLKSCPKDIDIPGAFKAYNNYKLFDKKLKNKIMYLANVGKKDGNKKWTSTCIDCGLCEKICPQDIEIRKKFKDIQEDLETKVLKKIIEIIN